MNGEEVVSLATNFVKDRTILGSQHHSQKGNRNHKNTTSGFKTLGELFLEYSPLRREA